MQASRPSPSPSTPPTASAASSTHGSRVGRPSRAQAPFTSRMRGRAASRPQKKAPPMVKVWRFFSTTRATRRLAGTQRTSSPKSTASMGAAGTPPLAASVSTNSSPMTTAEASRAPYQVRLQPCQRLAPTGRSGRLASTWKRSWGSSRQPRPIARANRVPLRARKRVSVMRPPRLMGQGRAGQPAARDRAARAGQWFRARAPQSRPAVGRGRRKSGWPRPPGRDCAPGRH